MLFWQGVIGITVAICGNVLISLALNFQKLAHRRLDREKALKARERELETRRHSAAQHESADEGRSQTPMARTTQTSTSSAAIETVPLLQHSRSDPSLRTYGTASSGGRSNSQASPPLTQHVQPSKGNLISRLISFPLRTTSHSSAGGRENAQRSGEHHSRHALLPVEDVCDSPVENGTAGVRNGIKGDGKEGLMVEHGNESDYLKSKLWCVQKSCRLLT
jgi:hypothetical protein